MAIGMRKQVLPLLSEQWCNENNRAFYESISYEDFFAFSEVIGLTDYVDLKNIEQYVKKSGKILELGAGYGRSLEFLLQLGYQGSIYAIERSDKFFSHLWEKYHGLVNLIHGDLLQYVFDQKFDLILWLWSGITDFTREEQNFSIKKMLSCLSEKGILVVDTIYYERNFSNPLLGVSVNKRNHQMKHENNVLYGFTQKKEEIEQICCFIGAKIEKTIRYKTIKNFDRVTYLISI